jgi:putative tryptophan/tyrosine transport system substrate-binding protein
MPLIDFEGIKAAALCNARSLLPELAPGGKFAGHEYVALNPSRADKASGPSRSIAEPVRREDIAPLFDVLKGQADALYVVENALTVANRMSIVTLALSARLPTIYTNAETARAGGLISYGPNVPELFRRAADYVDKILRGAKPGELPVEQPTKFDLVINLKTAKALGLTIPDKLLAIANDVVEE